MDVFAASAPIGLAGAGWYATERSPDGTCFRWVADGAWLDVAQLSGLMYEITLDIEPGPAVGLVEFDLAVYEDGTTWLATVTVPGRTRVAFRLAAGEARVRHLELRPQNTKDAVVVPLDPRSLRYRVFEVGVTAVPDVNHLEEQIVAGAATIADLSARVAELSSTAGAIAETANATNVQLRREIDARDAIIERLESADTRYRFEADELRSALDGRSAELENARTLADERLAVIRSLYEQGTRAAG